MFNKENIKEQNGFLYEMHCHSAGCSACARASAPEMVRAYHAVGYQGMVLTNHFIHGNNCVPEELRWQEKMERYWNEYLAAKEEGKKLDMDVLFGVEYYYGRGKEILTYGIDLEFLTKYPDLVDTPVEEYARRVHEWGGFLSLAHPFRVGAGIDPTVPLAPELADGIEIFNGCTPEDQNQKALALARERDLVPTSGADSHWVDQPCLGTAGLLFPHRIRTGRELVQALRRREGRPLWNGRLMEDR